eukprot:50014-Prymnesium_polylepis.2
MTREVTMLSVKVGGARAARAKRRRGVRNGAEKPTPSSTTTPSSAQTAALDERGRDWPFLRLTLALGKYSRNTF